jgi:hypothetical protein
MHDIELIVIWFSSVIGGAILTMLIPRMVPESHLSDITQGTCKQKGSMVLIGNESQITSSLSRYLQKNVSYLVFIDYCVKEPDEADASHGFGVARQ